MKWNIYIRFIDATWNDTEVLVYDCSWSRMVIYSDSTIIIYAAFLWLHLHQYYITFDSGRVTLNKSDYSSDDFRSIKWN